MKPLMISFAMGSLILGLAGGVQAGLIDYAGTRTGQYGTLNLQSGAFTSISNPGTGFEEFARLPGGPLYAVDSSTHLLLMNAATGSSNVIGTIGNSIFTIKLRSDGTMFGFNGSSLYTINTTTGASSLVGVTGISSPNGFDLAFDSSGRLFVDSSNGTTSSLYSVNQTTGQATLIGTTGQYDLISIDYENGNLYGLTVNTPTQELVTINTTTGAGSLVANISGVAPGGLIYGLATTDPAAVPEPSSVVMVCLGLATLGAARSARRRAASRRSRDGEDTL